MEEKEFLNKDLHNISFDNFKNQITNDFIGDDFIEQLEWSMLMIQNKFKQVKIADYLTTINANHFDKAYLISSNLNDKQEFFKPFTDLQATPKIFPNINLKILNISETIQLSKLKELDIKEKRNIKYLQKYVYSFSHAFFKKDTESFYCTQKGYEIGDSFFDYKNNNLEQSSIPNPISLHPNYYLPDNAWKYLSIDEIKDMYRIISMSYQIVMSMYYEWSIYIKEYDNIGLVIPIEPNMLSEIYKTSVVKFDDKKRMLHFVKDHYRRKVALPNEDYSIYVKKYLRGEHKFNYRNFYAEIIPPKYDINRIKTKKKFINPTE